MPRRDDGFTLLELLLSVGLIGLVGAFAIAFHTSSLSVTRQQANREVAAQLASEALDRARATGGAAVLARGHGAATRTVNGIRFSEEWTASPCTQAAPGGVCTTAPAVPGALELARVVVTVRWSEAGGVRSERVAALVSAAESEPVFPS